MLTTSMTSHPVAIIGAGPIGLAAAAHLAERGLPFLILEAGTAAGAAIAEWGAHAALLAMAVQPRCRRAASPRGRRLDRSRR